MTFAGIDFVTATSPVDEDTATDDRSRAVVGLTMGGWLGDHPEASSRRYEEASA